MLKFNHQFVISACAAVVLAAAVPQAGYAAGADTGAWKLNVEQSKFGPGANTLVIERAGDAKASTQGNVRSATASGKTFLVISNGKVYLATDDYAASTNSGIRQVDYSLWRGMRLVQIGDKVRSVDYCGFRCQSGLPDNRMTITFTAKDNIDMSKQPMHNVVVLNK